ncbi:putative amidophosphoribosyltransferase [Branchiibius hedensis]|uniref:Predicted amidophosphoribosyltransferases n=1 Tax=Branchiibius hedensis TaxID=672460 RepID=A0A2Y8ZX30_9MICO|nr:phosphoribosyltransferase family protein [Branchiibius hedensis]PWJ26007.1 putative amidophosphoribosyltransferase [Branchiibius hedensis]SSA34819.1 Predicted amidophosphoribosyltransferases [Branchiibius hedensis]
MGWLLGVRTLVTEVADLAMPRRCAGCGEPGVLLCGLCALQVRDAAAIAPFRSVPDPCPAGFPPAWSGTPYLGVVRNLLPAYKDHGRTDLRVLLGAWLERALVAGVRADSLVAERLSGGRPVYVVPAPSSPAARRARGRDPLRDLVLTAVAGYPGLPVIDALGYARRVRDQAGLSSTERARNLGGALRVRRGVTNLLSGQVCVLADDVVTTGATLAESARALRAAGVARVIAVTVAATPRTGSDSRAPAQRGPLSGMNPSEA